MLPVRRGFSDSSGGDEYNDSRASSCGKQHFLYFLPLPQWQTSLRRSFVSIIPNPFRPRIAGEEGAECTDDTDRMPVHSCDKKSALARRRAECHTVTSA